MSWTHQPLCLFLHLGPLPRSSHHPCNQKQRRPAPPSPPLYAQATSPTWALARPSASRTASLRGSLSMGTGLSPYPTFGSSQAGKDRHETCPGMMRRPPRFPTWHAGSYASFASAATSRPTETAMTSGALGNPTHLRTTFPPPLQLAIGLPLTPPHPPFQRRAQYIYAGSTPLLHDSASPPLSTNPRRSVIILRTALSNISVLTTSSPVPGCFLSGAEAVSSFSCPRSLKPTVGCCGSTEHLPTGASGPQVSSSPSSALCLSPPPVGGLLLIPLLQPPLLPALTPPSFPPFPQPTAYPSHPLPRSPPQLPSLPVLSAPRPLPAHLFESVPVFVLCPVFISPTLQVSLASPLPRTSAPT